MKRADICIGSMGLHGSTGWKTAEYIVAGKAVVCERLNYSNPGDFADGRNYLQFDTIEQCIAHIDYLVSHPDEIERMSQNNISYYNNYLRPDMLIANALRHIGN